MLGKEVPESKCLSVGRTEGCMLESILHVCDSAEINMGLRLHHQPSAPLLRHVSSMI